MALRHLMTLCHYGTTTPGVPGVPGVPEVPGVARRPRPSQRCYLHIWWYISSYICDHIAQSKKRNLQSAKQSGNHNEDFTRIVAPQKMLLKFVCDVILSNYSSGSSWLLPVIQIRKLRFIVITVTDNTNPDFSATFCFVNFFVMKMSPQI